MSERRRMLPRMLLAATMAAALLLAGCWDMRPVERLALVNLLLVDRTASGKVVVDAEVTSMTKSSSSGSGTSSGSSGGGSIAHVRGEGATPFQAFRAAGLSTVKRPYIGHIQVVLVGEREAKGHLGEVVDMFARDPQARMIAWIFAVGEQDIAHVMGTTAPGAAYPAEGIVELALQSLDMSPARPTRLYEVATLLATDEHGVAIPVLSTAQGTEGFRIAGLALFRHQTWAGTLSVDQATGYAWLAGAAHLKSATVACGKAASSADLVSYDIVREGKRVTPVVDPHGGLVGIHVALQGTARIRQVSGNCAVGGSLASHQAIRQAIARQVWQQAATALDVARASGTDPFGFGTAVRIGSPEIWQAMASRWADEVLPRLPVAVDVLVDLDGAGETHLA